jgi:hypothetical protein|nr:hypothetical protein [Kofleriaceae bacterium]
MVGKLTAAVLLAATAAATPALADDATSVDGSAPAPSPGYPHVGIMGDLGVPDGATASLVVRPIRMLRVEGGISTDGAGPGWRGGATLIPFSWRVSPVIGVTRGHMYQRNANAFAQEVSGDAMFSSPLLDKVGYDYDAARVGIEFGQRDAVFYLHGGVTHVSGQIHGISGATNDPDVDVWTVSADLGVIFYL